MVYLLHQRDTALRKCSKKEDLLYEEESSIYVTYSCYGSYRYGCNMQKEKRERLLTSIPGTMSSVHVWRLFIQKLSPLPAMELLQP